MPRNGDVREIPKKVQKLALHPGLSGSVTVRCLAAVLSFCGVPTMMADAIPISAVGEVRDSAARVEAGELGTD
jgi:hypothetical protein